MALLTILIVVAVLYFARSMLIPSALAVLLAFLLTPVVVRLRHFGLGRIPSAVVVIVSFLLIVSTIAALLSFQLADLAHKLPGYETNIHNKIESVRTSGSGVINRITRTVTSLMDDLTPRSAVSGRNQPPEERPVPVEIRR